MPSKRALFNDIVKTFSKPKCTVGSPAKKATQNKQARSLEARHRLIMALLRDLQNTPGCGLRAPVKKRRHSVKLTLHKAQTGRIAI